MSTITISLPDAVTQQVDREVVRGGFATRSEFFRDLIRRYITHEVVFESFEAKPLKEIESDLQKTGKYSDQFIKSVVNGLEKSSAYAD